MTQVSAHPKHFLSDKVEHFTESVIRDMTRQAMQYGAVNLAQGFPDFSARAEIKRAAQPADEGVAGTERRSRKRNRCLLWFDRGHDRNAARGLQQGRRGSGLRAVL